MDIQTFMLPLGNKVRLNHTRLPLVATNSDQSILRFLQMEGHSLAESSNRQLLNFHDLVAEPLDFPALGKRTTLVLKALKKEIPNIIIITL